MRLDFIDQRGLEGAEGLQALLKDVARAVLQEEALGQEASFSVSIVDEGEIRRANARFRGVDEITDVLSFPQVGGRVKTAKKADLLGAFDPEDGTLFLGDLLICDARVRGQAEEYGHSVFREYGYMLAHGLLHLLGYDHETSEEKGQMRALEERALAAIGLKRE
ncbi:MAG: rRNA maturation RNase YbeY [Christensenellaceae bacterium]|jgi:probable rRNA maturation factor|nr:rRNA maturation RNase YbeY [Christensenellaceae bacterium]